MKFNQVLNEAKGARKRKKTLKSKYGKKNYKDYEKCIKDLKGKDGYTLDGGGEGTGKYNIYAICNKALKK